MPKPKIDRVKLNRMLTSGKAQKEIAQVFGVSEGAISRAKKELNIAVVKTVALESAHKVVSQNLDTLAQLAKINHAINGELDQIQEELGKAKGAERVVLQEVQIKHSAEIRKQLALQLEIFKTLYDVQAVANFQNEVLQAIGEVSREVRARIITRLKEIRALRGSVSINSIGG